MKARRLRYRHTVGGAGPRVGSLLRSMTRGGGWSRGEPRPTGTVYRVIRVVSVKSATYSLIVARVYDEKPRAHRGVFPLFWDRQ